jgi:prevent-host-death family protein
MASKIQKRVGKAQAREEFSTLIESVAKGGGAVEITDYGKVSAVLVSEEESKEGSTRLLGLGRRSGFGKRKQVRIGRFR